MGWSSDELISWSRMACLLIGLSIAAWMDHKERRVPNSHWIVWSKPAIFLWALSLMIQDADVYTFLTALGVVAYASIAVIGRPTIPDILKGSKVDILVSLWYMIGIAGVVGGYATHSDTSLADVINGEADKQAALWWKTLATLIPIVAIDIAWRVRLIHGGADCKAIMWIALMIPDWSAIPIPMGSETSEALVALPPALALLMWGGAVFLILPFVILVRNIASGNMSSIADLRLAWHATVMKRDEVLDAHVWLLTTVIEMPDGSKKAHHRTRAPSRTPSREELSEQLENLKQLGVDEVWITHKHPLLVFLLPAVLPLFIFGDLITIAMVKFGIA